MATHAAMPTRHRTRARAPARRVHGHTALARAVPLAPGVIPGSWASFVRRDGGAATGGQIRLGAVSGPAFAVLRHALARIRRAAPREPRAAASGVLAGARPASCPARTAGAC
ncbi:hypothetical protein [Streptomyces sp. NPDC014623]|uniref:hypothetical protein n=1 Tax=Streptomyces sp. NPDC014623 TaxID=3364875 RepID=UPI0036FC9397